MRLLALLLLMGAGAAGSPAVARLVPHSTVIDHFGECMLKRDGERSRALMQTGPGSDEELRLMKALAKRGGNCIKTMYELGMRTGAMRGAIAGALLRRDESAIAALRQAAPATPPVVPLIEVDRGQMVALAECVAASAPADSVEIILSRNASEAEQAAIARVQPALAGCLPQGLTIRMDRHDLRSNLADALYRKLNPAVPPASFTRKD